MIILRTSAKIATNTALYSTKVFANVNGRGSSWDLKSAANARVNLCVSTIQCFVKVNLYGTPYYLPYDIYLHYLWWFSVVDTRSVETTIIMARICKYFLTQMYKTNRYVDGRPIDIDYTFLRESSAAHACVVKTGWKTEGDYPWLWTLNAKSLTLLETSTRRSSKLTGGL